MDIASYRNVWKKYHGYFSLNLATTRGCPYKCNWCAKPIWGQRYNARSPENVAAANYPGNNSSAVIVELWKQSKDHHKNMVDDWTDSGMGVVVDSDGMVFATQIFATRNYSHMTMRDRMNSF